MPTENFEAGNEFVTPSDAVAAALKGDVEPQATPESTDTPAETPEDSAPQGDEARASWEDPRPEDAEATDAPQADKPAPAVSSLEVKGNRGMQKFNLDPNDEALKRTLQMGMVAPQWKRERDQANARATESDAKLAAVSAKTQVVDELERLTQAGHYEQAVRSVLGEKGFAAFVTQMVEEAVEYSDADPTRRTEIERKRDDRTRQHERYQSDRKLQDRESRLSELEDRIESGRLESLGTVAMRTHDFRKVIPDTDVAHNLNQKLWRLAWADLEDAAEAGKSITAEAIDSAFESNARVLKSVIARQAQAQVTKVVETKKQDAKAKAQIAATERYPRSSTPDLTGWNGTSSKDLLKRLVKGNR